MKANVVYIYLEKVSENKSIWCGTVRAKEDKELCEKPEAHLGKKRALVDLGTEEVCPLSLSLD